METKYYSDLYLSDISENMGAMLEYGMQEGYDPQVIWNLFLNSKIAKQIEMKNPQYLAGYSGQEYLNMIIKNQIPKKNNQSKKRKLSFNEYYWSGWALAQLQFKTNITFNDIDSVLPLSRVLELYEPLHEADISKFIDVAKTYLSKAKKETNLKIIRKASGYSQNDLAIEAKVDLRSIQMYEQRRNDINKAQVATLVKISKVLSCKIEDLLEY